MEEDFKEVLYSQVKAKDSEIEALRQKARGISEDRNMVSQPCTALLAYQSANQLKRHISVLHNPIDSLKNLIALNLIIANSTVIPCCQQCSP